jgi:GWxTD domain-containing protein
MRLSTLVIVSMLGFAGSTVHAQQPVNVDSLREQLAHETNVTELRRRETQLQRTAQTTDALLERGLILIRLYELQRDNDHATKARDATERAVRQSPKDARTHYAYALANSTELGVRIPSPAGVLDGVVLGQSVAEILKTDPASKAKRSFKKALELDPDLDGAALGLARNSLSSRDRDNMEAAAHALRRLVGVQRGGAAAATLLSEVEAALGNVAAAAEAGVAASKTNPRSSSALRAQAAAQFRQEGREEEAARTYFSGIDALDTAGAAAYYDDVVPIITDRERNDWLTSNLESRREWLRRFWDVRAASSGITVAERIAEHYRRLAMAHEQYRRTSKRGSPPTGVIVKEKYSGDMLPFDERGLILVRHGEPAHIVRSAGVDLRPNETWVYIQRPRNRLFNFVVHRDATDFRLVDDVLQAVDPSTQGIPVEAFVKLLRDREAYEPRYAALASKFESFQRNAQRASAFGASPTFEAASLEGMHGAVETRQRIAEDLRAVAMTALETDSDGPDFTGDLPFYYDIYSFKGRNGLTDVTSAAAIPASSLSAREMGGKFIYALKASLIFIDTLTSEITRKDTVYMLRSNRQLGADEHIRLHLDLAAPVSGAGTHRIVLRDLITPGKGQLYGGAADLKQFEGDALMISDVVLAEPDNGTWQRGNATLGLVPPRQFQEGRPLRLFYELYNLAPETPYRTEIMMDPIDAPVGFGRIKRLLGGGSGKVQLQFDGVAPTGQGVIQELRQVTPQVKPGKYRVIVRVTNLQNQQTVRSETMFIVLKAQR